ncbi:MAG TPA: hypothetical protein VGX23_33140 [Actinocrinis sp.]|nr:hypothetical protein [Actinocrinis sp.]
MADSTSLEFARTHTSVVVDLTRQLNNVALTTLHTLHRGQLNVWGNSLPAEALPAKDLTVDGITFALARGDGSEPDNIRCAGQHLDLPPTPGTWLHLVAGSERRCEEFVYLHYASGAVDPEWLRVSDFWPARPHFGELPAVRTTQMHYPHHCQEQLGGQLWAVRVPVRRREPLCGLGLPDNPALHVFALSIEGVR